MQTQVRRTEISDEQVPWTHEFPSYDPVTFTDQSILDQPDFADPDISM